jgi:hypothetical protein
MPEPGDLCPGFIAQPGECWQMIYDRTCRRPIQTTTQFDFELGDKPMFLSTTSVLL